MSETIDARCNTRPQHGSARCDLAAGHDGRHSAPLAIGGRITYDDSYARLADLGPASLDRLRRTTERAGA
ncbi:hypothetical protein ACFWNQ_15155 [Streptomyces virginiae]|uniref:hypothetical protein n=1 Tax=Streptomyces virginiae TaxID=1961 RepID=UPI0036658860